MNGHVVPAQAGTQPARNGAPDNLDARLRGHDGQPLPTGVIVGSAIIGKCVKNCDPRMYEWHLTSVKRLKRPRKVKGKPQPVWFRPWPV